MSNDFAAIMFSDVSGSSRLFKLVGDEQARSIVSKVVSMMIQCTLSNNGVVIKTIGDEVMASFPTPHDAIHAAIEIQQDIDTIDYGAPLSIHIGLHYGAVILEDGDVYGEAVNDAADLVKIAKGGQIITSQRTVNELPDKLRDKCSRFDEIRMKGGKANEVVYFVKWEEEGEDPSNSTIFMSAIDVSMFDELDETKILTLHYEGESIVVTKNDVPFSIGRGQDCDLTVLFRMASRNHCTIDYRRGKFVLIDESTNGTYTAPDGRSSLYLRREETPLQATGTISFSPEMEGDGPHRIRYTC
ncbi:MAG: adenylate cyclase [Cyclobacteriaceae bacterium]